MYKCPHYQECGGCSLQHLPYEAQLEAKKAKLEDALGHGAPSIAVVPSKPWGYRNRVSLHALRSNTFPRCGFKARKSDTVIPIGDCPVAVDGIRHLLPRLLPPPGKDRFTLYCKDSTLIAETGTSCSGGGKAPENIPDRGTISLAGREITLEASSFFQSNAGAQESLIAELGKAAAKTAGIAGGPGTMADLYCGVGALSLFLADLYPGGADLVEEDARAVELAKINLAKTSNPGKCHFYPKKVEQWLKKRNLGCYSAIVADPPRQGLSPVLVLSLCNSGPPMFVYISCEAATFARDYRLLAGKYYAESLYLFDFYPQTLHIETMGIFIRK